MTPFIVLTMARSGSHHLQCLLNGHSRVRMRGELLKDFDSLSDRDLIRAGFAAPEGTGIAAVGFKILHEQIAGRPLTLPRLLAVPGLHVIVLERRNQLERLRSDAQAHAVNRWAVDTPPEGVLPTVALEPMLTLWWLRVATAFHRQLRELPCATWVYYEDLISDQGLAMMPVWQFLGVPPRRLNAGTYQQESRSLAETVSNFEQLHTAFAGTPYESLLTKGA